MVISLKKLVTLLLVATLTACTAPSSLTSSPPTTPGMLSSPTAMPSTATPIPNPLNVQVAVDESLAVSAVISTAGGTLAAQAADGTRFTLVFPKGALQSDETITLKPIAGVDGLPFSGGLVAGVQMEPEGLRLFQPATLSIESPKTVASEGYETVAFGYHEDGQGVYLNPSTVENGILTLEVWHFSGVGAAQATPDEIQTQQQQNVPSNAEDAFTQNVQEYLGIQRQAEFIGKPDPNFKDRISEFLRQAYDSFIAPQLPIALEDCDKAPAIISKALGWARQASLLGQTNENGNEFKAEIDKIIQTYEQVKEKCVQNYVGEGKYRISGEQSGLEVISGYEFLITFRANANGTIVGEGVMQKVEASMGSKDFQCTDPEASALVFPAMRITGKVIPDATGQPATFKLTIVGPASTSTSEYTCVHPIAGTWALGAAQDQGFFLNEIEIAAKDGAQAHGEESTAMQGVTGVTTWELEIHKQANP